MFSPNQLEEFCHRPDLHPSLHAACKEWEINTPGRISAFMAQLHHESGGFRHLREIWGPTEAQKRYEGRKDLGNIRPGDGSLYRGRGWIQLTGRANYRRYGELLNLPLEKFPGIAEDPEVAARIAGCYWYYRGLNKLCDGTLGGFRAITRRINGGYNGWLDRVRQWNRARVVFNHLSFPVVVNGRVIDWSYSRKVPVRKVAEELGLGLTVEGKKVVLDGKTLPMEIYRGRGWVDADLLPVELGE